MSIHVPAEYPVSGKAKIAFVGEAPSVEEIDKGVPLVGPSGRIFNAILRTANLDRSEFLITNVFDEQLPGNDVAAWCADLQEARENKLTDLPPIGSAGFLRQEHRWHLERLREEILDVRPNVIVALGATALWAFTGDTNIGNFRGTPRLAKYIVPGAKIFPTFHPAFVMQQWKYFPVVTEDFNKAAREADLGRNLVLPNRRLLLEPTIKELLDYEPKLLASDLLSVDIETGWGTLTCIGFAPNQEEAVCVPFSDLRSPSRSYWRTPDEELQAWGLVKRLCESDTPKLGQNFSGYDLYWLLEKYGIRVHNLVHDTRLMHHALYPELEKSLAFMGASYSTQGSWKHWGKKQEKRDD